MRYLPHTDADVARMLQAIGLPSIDALFGEMIPARLALGRKLDLPPALDEATLAAHLAELAGKNVAVRPTVPGSGPLAFLGAGHHPHYVPAAVDMLLRRAEFYTSYTPYQPEIAQGTLQAIFEFQSIVCELTGLDVANASMYDGASACAEAVLMARRITGRTRTLVTAGLHPEYLETCRTYLAALPGSVEVVPTTSAGATDVARLEAQLDAGDGDDVACLVVQTPSFHGVVEDLARLAACARARGALVIAVTTDPLTWAVAEAPGRAGADIAVAEAIGLALGASFGGPALGLFAAKAEHLRQMPGRLCGETVDKDGRRGYVLTLSTREQHIRRDKATSNICTNTGLVSLAFTINMSLLGRRGFGELARLIYAKTRYLRAQSDRLAARGYALAYPTAPHFSELALRVPGGDAALIATRAAERGVIPGVPLGRFDNAQRDLLLVSVCENHRREDLDRLVAVLEEVA